MLYMGNVNRVIFWILIPLVLISYIAFRFFVWGSLDDGQRSIIAEQHAVNLSNSSDINCLILGGSNAVFSLSAEQISVDSELSCYNLSLLNEGYSYPAYWDYIQSLPIEAEKIKYVFYSSIVPYRSEKYLEEKHQNALNELGISGDLSFNLLGVSIASITKEYMQNEFSMASAVQFPSPSFYGDFVFSAFYGCKSDIKIKSEQTTDFASLEIWANSQLAAIISIFPNADRYFVLPSERRDKFFNPSIQAEMVEHMRRALSASIGLSTANYLIVQPPFDDNSILCNSKHHANAKGREIRTANLIQLFNATY